jgi:RNA polymerase sigma-70 factor (ECF subfamily)
VEDLYRRYSRDVFALTYRVVGSRADAEDLAQTTFLNAHRALLDGARPSNERAWLLAIARNACCSRFRTLARRPREEAFDDSALASRAPDHEPAQPVLDALRALPARQRSALVLAAMDGCTTTEIGERLGMRAPAVEALLHRARTALRDELQTGAARVGCTDTEDLVGRQLRGEVTPDEKAALRGHLRACTPCARVARRLRARRRLASLFLLPWDLVSRAAGVFGQGSAGVKTASVLGALVVGATAATERGAPSQPAVTDGPRASVGGPTAQTAFAPARSRAATQTPARARPRPAVTATQLPPAEPAASPRPPAAQPAGTADPPAPLPPPTASPSPPQSTGGPATAPAAATQAAPAPGGAGTLVESAGGVVTTLVDDVTTTLSELPQAAPPATEVADLPAPQLPVVEGAVQDAAASLPAPPAPLPPLPLP